MRVCFFNDTATTEIYTLSLHDALPISHRDLGAHAQGAQARGQDVGAAVQLAVGEGAAPVQQGQDRKSTRLNSSHANISYAVFCLKKKQVSNRLDQNYIHTLISRRPSIN